jgi:Holliday junction resolvase-like predicted endonuclease
MAEEQKTQNLLDNVGLITKKYDDIAKITGEKFNIFSIMSMESNERYTHSAIIGELLNPKGSHGQGSVFLKLFFNEIIQLKAISNFDFDNVKILIEQYIGSINHDFTQGGFIDIVIKDDNNVVVIENKIHAPDQKNQLLRYKNHYKKCVLLYLNLFGDDASEGSRVNLKLDLDYHIITYNHHIKNWLENCFKEAANQPIVRETIKQYLNSVKKLTNQTINSDMSNEIVNLILKNNDNLENANQIANSLNVVKNAIVNKVKNLVNMSDVDKTFLNNKIKEVFEFGHLKILPFWQESNYKLIRYDIVTNLKDERVIIHVEARNTEIHIRYLSNIPALQEKLVNSIEIKKFNYYSKDDEMYDEIKRQVLEILNFLANNKIEF